jgi:hypothetical protein
MYEHQHEEEGTVGVIARTVSSPCADGSIREERK